MFEIKMYVDTVITIVDRTDDDNLHERDIVRKIIEDYLYDISIQYGHYRKGFNTKDELISQISPYDSDFIDDAYLIYEFGLEKSRLDEAIGDLIDELRSYPFVKQAYLSVLERQMTCGPDNYKTIVIEL